MRLSANHTSPDHHQIVAFIKDITVDGVRVQDCVYFDTIAGVAVCANRPLKCSDGINLDTHEVKGAIKIVWDERTEDKHEQLFQHFKSEWEQRELQRMEAEAKK